MRFLIGVALCCGLLCGFGNGFVLKLSSTKADVSSILTQLAAADTNAASGSDVVVDYQDMASHSHFDHDNSPKPFFTSVSSALLGKPTYAALTQLLAAYTTPDATADETVTPAKQTAITAFYSAVKATDVFKTAQTYLQTTIKGDLDAILNALWFEPFARSGSTTKGASGFKSVYAGEVTSGKVTGYNNWVQFYTQEAASIVNYHGWFNRQKDVQVAAQFSLNTAEALERNFLIGTSPEFEFVAYSICALVGGGSCSFTLGGYDVVLNVETLTDGNFTKISYGTPSIGSGGGSGGQTSTTKKQGGGTGGDGDLQALIDKMAAADVDKAGPSDVVLDWGSKVSGTGDVSNGPLFKYVNESLFTRPVYAKLIEIYNDTLFHPAVCTAEPAMNGLRKAQLDDYLKLLTSTDVFKLAHQYLVAQGVADADEANFYSKVFNLWYGTYSRCKGALGSSGWEHVYSGEWKGEEIDGQHNWVRYYLLEKSGHINYHGYDSHEGDLIGSFQYTWENYLKKVGGFFISTSPAFDLSVFTTCVLAHSGAGHCKFTLNNAQIIVTSYHQACDAGTCLSTSYPSDH
uniref:Endoribonuclease n=1 Tax=Panagrellus redivivus TaxID=6233 RepID=A0A7E4VNA3_PANRE